VAYLLLRERSGVVRLLEVQQLLTDGGLVHGRRVGPTADAEAPGGHTAGEDERDEGTGARAAIGTRGPWSYPGLPGATLAATMRATAAVVATGLLVASLLSDRVGVSILDDR